jgi:hypothetical protein
VAFSSGYRRDWTLNKALEGQRDHFELEGTCSVGVAEGLGKLVQSIGCVIYKKGVPSKDFRNPNIPIEG